MTNTETSANISKERLATVGITQEKYDKGELTPIQKSIFEQYLKSIK